MSRYKLFRINVRKKEQKSYIHKELTSTDVLFKALHEKPSRESQEGYQWHIGNVQYVKYLSETEYIGVTFCLGRSSTARVQKYIEDTGEFREEEEELAPFTRVVVYLNHQICAISRHPDLGGRDALARHLERLLNTSSYSIHGHWDFSVTSVTDPTTVANHIREAFKVRRFKFTVSRPNLWDSQKEIEEPFERFVDASDANTGDAEVRGDELNADPLVDLARSVSARGNSAEVELESEDGETYVKSSKESPVTLEWDEESTETSLESFLVRIADAWHELKQDDDGGQ